VGPELARCVHITESSKATFKFDDATAIKFLMHSLFSGCTNWPGLEKGNGKKRAAGAPAASVATAVDLGGEKGSAPPAKCSNSSLKDEAVYAMGVLAGISRTNERNKELRKEGVARRVTSCVSAQEYKSAVCAWVVFVARLSRISTLRGFSITKINTIHFFRDFTRS
jgi:hypothetical protein